VAENDSNRRNSRKRRSKRNHVDKFNKERVTKQQRQDSKSYSISDCRTRASTAKKHKSQLKCSCHDLLNEGQASKQPKHNSQNPSLYKTSDTTDPTLIGEPLVIQPFTTQDSRATAARSTKARSICYSAPKKTRSEANTPGKVVLVCWE
jgi:hypothetical protein